MAKHKRQMTPGTCRRIKGGKHVCRLKSGKVVFKGANIYKGR